jgi:hypothetical protein
MEGGRLLHQIGPEKGARDVRFIQALSVVLMLAFCPNGAAAQSHPFGGFPPVVVGTFPPNGELNVDPSIKEIRVTFSKDMMTEKMWSWVIHTPEVFPKITGEVKYLADGRTNVAQVELDANRTYAIWFNSPDYRHNAFRDLQNNPAVPYLLVFRTGD